MGAPKNVFYGLLDDEYRTGHCQSFIPATRFVCQRLRFCHSKFEVADLTENWAENYTKSRGTKAKLLRNMHCSRGGGGGGGGGVLSIKGSLYF